jgi:hypothetical protein
MPLLDQFGDPTQFIATAVTPVVMVSATAILVSGVNSRYIAIADRVRALSHEFRDANTSPDRRHVIRRQMPVFRRRMHLVSSAMRILYVSAGCFVGVALLIGMSVSKPMAQSATLATFLVGLVGIMAAIVLQYMELQESNKTIDIESADVLAAKE